jgi:hypothetical protein
VLFALQSGFNLMDFAGPLEVLTTALHVAQDPSESPPGAASLFPTPHLPLS